MAGVKLIFLNGRLLNKKEYRFTMESFDRGVFPVLQVRNLQEGDCVVVYEVADVQERNDIPIELLVDEEAP